MQLHGTETVAYHFIAIILLDPRLVNPFMLRDLRQSFLDTLANKFGIQLEYLRYLNCIAVSLVLINSSPTPNLQRNNALTKGILPKDWGTLGPSCMKELKDVTLLAN